MTAPHSLSLKGTCESTVFLSRATYILSANRDTEKKIHFAADSSSLAEHGTLRYQQSYGAPGGPQPYQRKQRRICADDMPCEAQWRHAASFYTMARRI